MNSKPDKLTIWRAVLVSQMNHWTLFPLYVMLNAIYNNMTGTSSSSISQILLWLAFGCLPFLLYLGRTFLRKLPLLLLVHSLVLIIMFLVPTPHLAIQIIHIGFGLYYVIVSACIWLKTTHRNDFKINPIVNVCLSTFMLFVLSSQGHPQWASTLVSILIFTLALYFIVYYIERYQHFLAINESTAGYLPEKEILRSGMSSVITYTCIGFFILFLFSNIAWLKVLFQSIEDFLSMILNIIFSTVPQENIENPMSASLDMAADMAPMGMDMNEKPLWIWIFLENLIIVAVVVLLIFVFIKVILFVVKFLRDKLNETTPETTVSKKKEEVRDVREKCEIVQERKSEGLFSFLSQDPKKKIRQLYKKRILASEKFQSNLLGTAEQDLKLCTARESAKILEREQMGLLYEKARYSNADCSVDDVKQMKNACR